jgi:hypothetical protein
MTTSIQIPIIDFAAFSAGIVAKTFCLKKQIAHNNGGKIHKDSLITNFNA